MLLTANRGLAARGLGRLGRSSRCWILRTFRFRIAGQQLAFGWIDIAVVGSVNVWLSRLQLLGGSTGNRQLMRGCHRNPPRHNSFGVIDQSMWTSYLRIISSSLTYPEFDEQRDR
ncbi:hypothetical protein ACFYO1_11540 [Nocardia sp. NPDC006044]|uniref:hypothetical protein n=1 Tax=Nocardia sp. NPDC006044 TaxID=3364306 RepID=UPI0036A3ADA6